MTKEKFKLEKLLWWKKTKTPEISEEQPRTIKSNNPEFNAQYPYAPNGISTTKYTPLNFVPKNLFEQFRRPANFYFLIIAVLQVVPGLSPISPVTSWVPLIGVLMVTAIKEAIEDWRRHKMDEEINNREVEVVRGGVRTAIKWSELCVGDIVFCKNGHHFPADLLLLSTSETQGLAYIETSNLDGETNLKIREAVTATNRCRTEHDITSLQISVECEGPNNRLYNFDGAISVGQAQSAPVGVKQVLLRGCVLRNTGWIWGIVIFTGHETKLMKNATETPSKRSSLEVKMNGQLYRIFALLLLLIFISAVAGGAWVSAPGQPWYTAQRNPAEVGGLGVLVFLILFNTMVPISLYVSIEMVKVAQALLINSDSRMYHEDSDTPARARTSNLSEELGQIEYLFSDKTGTLTQNRMEFLKCSIAGVCYGSGTTEIGRAAAKRAGKSLNGGLEEDDEEAAARRKSSAIGKMKGFNLYDDRLLDGAWRNQPNADSIRDFFVFLAVCHTVIPERDTKDPSILQYQAASPDEGALVAGAHGLGFVFQSRTQDSVTISIDGEGEYSYEVLNVLEFNSTRKRMSVVVRDPNGRILLMCKGADSVIMPRLKRSSPFQKETLTHLTDLAEEGLRTLCIAQCELDPHEYAKWNRAFYEASIAITGRDEKLDAAAELVEKDLELVGATAIEDKLQDGVPDCIATLAKAGIRIWVLTGDKQETAINIGFACALLTNEMNLYVVNAANEGDTRDQIEAAIAKISSATSGSGPSGLVIDGASLHHALGDTLKARFLALGRLCTAVICCRVSPLQKALVVKLVKDSVGAITLAIGDGANDVSMIQAAHVGVGISGQEGMQAVMSSDYAIAQFRYLHPLLLTHGRWNYQRIAKIVCYSFYKNIVMSFTQFWFNCFTAFSGATLHDSWHISFFNVFFTSVPIVVLAIFDQDVDMNALTYFPQLYQTGQASLDFNDKIFLRWILEAIFHSFVVFFFPAFAMGGLELTGHTRIIGTAGLGTTIYACVVITVTLRLAQETRYWTVFNHMATWGSIAAFFFFSLIYGAIEPAAMVSMSSPPSANMYYVVYVLFGEPMFWLLIVLVPCIALLPSYVYLVYQRQYHPTNAQIVQEMNVAELREEESRVATGGADGYIDTYGGEGLKPPVAPSAATMGGGDDNAEADEVPTVSACALAHHVSRAGATCMYSSTRGVSMSMLHPRKFVAARMSLNGSDIDHTGFAFSQERGHFPFPITRPTAT